jgi:hypothetical protein
MEHQYMIPNIDLPRSKKNVAPPFTENETRDATVLRGEKKQF